MTDIGIEVYEDVWMNTFFEILTDSLSSLLELSEIVLANAMGKKIKISIEFYNINRRSID